MKKILLILIITCSCFAQAQTTNRKADLQNNINNSEIVFEGYFVKKNPSFLTKKREIFTLVDYKVTKMIKGVMPIDSIIKIETEGGSVNDPETGMQLESFDMHGSLFSKKCIVFLYPKNERGNNKAQCMIDVTNSSSLSYSCIKDYENKPYTNVQELYDDINSVTGTKLTYEKKNVVRIENQKSENIISLSYAEKKSNFEKINALKIKLANETKSVANKTSLVNDVTFQITNTVIIGSTFQFDVNIKCNNSSTYLDNAPVWISYNSAVFGSSVVAANNVTVTNGTPFNNTNYYPANSYIIDNTASEFAFAVSAIVSNPIRTNITTTYKFLAKVQLKISNCGNVNTNLSNSVTAINSLIFTTTSNGSNLTQYGSLSYMGGPFTNSISVCPPIIKDFTSPINGGVNQTLTIKGKKFGSVRGNGQVKFRTSDQLGFPYFNKLDNLDYLFWNDTMIQVRMPSTIDTLFNGKKITPGSGNFKVVTNVNDSVTSNLNLASNTFSVYYSIYNLRPIATQTVLSRNQKLKTNLYKSVNSTGGYVIRIDTSVGNDPMKKMCVKKAIKDWACLTTVNIKLGTDTVYSAYGAYDNICNITFVDKSVMSDTSNIAETRVNSSTCNSSPPIRITVDFDIRINKKFLPRFWYDTTLNTLPAFKYDFLEIMYHEIGHGIGLMHVNDSSAVMFYRALGNKPYTIPGIQRRRLIWYTTDVDGGSNQVLSSQATVNGQCLLQDMILLNSGSCSTVDIKELYNNNFNLIVYPNPTTDGIVYLTFDSHEKIKPTVEIRDILGKLIYSETLINNYNDHYNHKLDLNNFNTGVYILNINVNNVKASYKLIKQ